MCHFTTMGFDTSYASSRLMVRASALVLFLRGPVPALRDAVSCRDKQTNSVTSRAPPFRLEVSALSALGQLARRSEEQAHPRWTHDETSTAAPGASARRAFCRLSVEFP